MVNAIRTVLRTYIALITFLGSYFLLTVVGNLVYFSPIGDRLGNYAILGFSIRNFETGGSAGYWILLFLPFVVAPPVVEIVRRVLTPWIVRNTPSLNGPSKMLFLALLLPFYLFAFHALWRADAIHLLTRATDYEAAVSDRFLLLAALGFWPQMVIKAALVTLSLFGLIRALATKDSFWIAITGVNLVIMSALLILLNMKWPLVLFYGLQIVAIVLFAERPLIPGIFFSVLAGSAYVLISLVLIRAVPMPTLHSETATRLDPAHRGYPPGVGGPEFKDAISLSFLTILNRMAQPFPYYYDIFAHSPGKCGTLVDRIERKTNPCHPSNLVYAEMFADRFAGAGTAPQAVHVTGYALSGWAGALIELLVASVMIGFFAAIAAVRGPIVDTAVVIGAMMGYHFSQLPVEGPIIYDHGILWCGIVLTILAAAGMINTAALSYSSEPS
jgi:hypothetical protein